jgi:hypothetical protein
LSRPPRSRADLRKLAEVVSEINDGTRRDIAELHRLQPPAADGGVVEAMLATADSQVALTVSYAKALEGGEAAKIESVAAETLATVEKVSRMARRFGFKVCGKEK